MTSRQSGSPDAKVKLSKFVADLYIVLLIVILSLDASPTDAFPVCHGPPNSFISIVVQKQKTPPTLSLIVGPTTDSPCTSSVDASLTEEPSWQFLRVKDGVQISVDDKGTIVALEKVPITVVPHRVMDAARKQGLKLQ